MIANLRQADGISLLYALAGGAVFNIANLLLVAAISIAGLAVAFPVGIGLALVVGALLNYAIAPAGNPMLLFGGVALVLAAIVVDALAYRARGSDGSTNVGARPQTRHRLRHPDGHLLSAGDQILGRADRPRALFGFVRLFGRRAAVGAWCSTPI